MGDSETTASDSDRREALPRSTLFVGRERELAELSGGLSDALGGRGRLFLIAGEPGIGKTHLAEQLALQAADRGALILAGHCYEMEGAAPYIPFVEIMETALARAPSPEAYRESLGEEAAEMARIMPRLRLLFPDIPPPITLPAEQERRYFFNSFCDVLARAARVQPLCLVLDDLQWADESTLLLIEHLAQRLPDLPLLVLGTYRDVDLDVSRPLARSLDELLRRRLARRLPLARLSGKEVEEMLRGLAGEAPPAALTTAVYEETEGNPFFVEEVFQHLAEEGRLFDERGRFRLGLTFGELDVPESVRLTIGRRLERFSEATRRMLTTAAMVGRDFAFELLKALSDADGEAVLAALEKAERAGVITSFPRGGEARFAFTHELIRQTLVSALSLPRRQHLHLRVAEAIRQVHGDAIDEHVSELAYHYYRAGSLGKSEDAAHLLLLAGDRALAGAAFGEAVRHYEWALSLRKPGTRERADVLSNLGLAQLSLGRQDPALESWEEALTTYERLGDAETVGRLCRLIAYRQGWNMRHAEAFQMAERGLAALGDRVSADRCSLLAIRGVVVGDHETGEATIGEALRMAEGLGGVEALALVTWSRAGRDYTSMHFERMRDDARRAVALLRRANGLWELAELLSLLQVAERSLGYFDEAMRIARELDPLAKRIGNMDAALLSMRTRASVEFARTGDFEKFAAFVPDDVELCRRGVIAEHRRAGGHFIAGLADFCCGNWEKAVESFGEAEAAASRSPAALGYWAFLALIQAYAGRREEALRLCAERQSELARPGRVNDLGSWVALFAAVETFAVAGAREKAADFYPLVLEAIGMGIVLRPYYDLRLLQTVAGIAAGAGGQWEAAEEHFRKALRQADELPNRLEQADARRFYAQMLLERREPGDREQARTFLEQAIAGYERMRMPRHRSMAEALLAFAGANLRAVTAPDGTVTLMFSDMEGFTEMTERLGDAAALDVIRAHNKIVRDQLKAHGGTELELQGDGFLLAFPKAGSALQCAIDIQRALAAHGMEHPDQPIRVRIGIHSGEPIKEADRFFGKSVILAARIAAQAKGGEILVSSVVRDLSEGTAHVRFDSGREVELKGLAGKRRVFRALWSDEDSSRQAVEEAAPAPTQGSVFRREGDYWTVVYEGKAFRLKDAKGLRYVAELLRNPGKELHVAALVAAAQTEPSAMEHTEAGLQASGLGDAGEILDAQAKAQYGRRLEDLRETLAEAERFNDPERAASARAEIEFLSHELASAVGLGGRDRKAASAVERARLNVTLAIKAALKRIAENSPSLAQHLQATVRTGKFCSYSPDPRAPISWGF